MAFDALFLDRDGTLNVERADYVRSRDQMVLLPGVMPALRLLSSLGAPIIVVTNQSAIGRGLVDAATVEMLHTDLQATAAAQGARIDAVYVCPHRPEDGCTCRKPLPGLLRRAAADFGLDLARCLLIGDSANDAGAARAAGCRCILVKTGRQGALLEAWRPAGGGVPVVAALPDAARLAVRLAAKPAQITAGDVAKAPAQSASALEVQVGSRHGS